jgi:hypothetical protein
VTFVVAKILQEIIFCEIVCVCIFYLLDLNFVALVNLMRRAVSKNTNQASIFWCAELVFAVGDESNIVAQSLLTWGFHELENVRNVNIIILRKVTVRHEQSVGAVVTSHTVFAQPWPLLLRQIFISKSLCS